VPLERRQFALLHRDFLFRLVDLELLSSHGDIQKLLGQFAALLGAFSFVLAILLLPRYALSKLPEPQLAAAAWGDEEFLISTTIAIVGVFAVIAWNAVLPDRRDSLVLGPLPVRIRTIFAAKVTAILTGVGISIVTINIFTGITVPLFLGGVRCLAAYWITMAAAGLFVFCALLAVQGMAAQVLSYRLFLRVSSFLQLAAFFTILSLYFLTPPLATLRRLTAPENQGLLAWLPSFWFLGLFQELHGQAHPAFGPLAARALRNLSIAFGTAAASYALMYFRHLRRIVEQPDIVPADRTRPVARWGSRAAAALLAKPLDRAILLFTARSIARSRQHRFLLAAFGGVGLAVAFAYVKDLIYGRVRLQWNHVTVEGLSVSLVLLTFAVVGARAVFTLPLALRANWIFRITAVQQPAEYFAAVRKALFGLTAAPVWIAAAVYYFAVWPGRLAVEHLIAVGVAGILLVDLSLYRFRKIPFACSYLPGAANLKVKLGVYVGAFILITGLGTTAEFAALQSVRGFAVFLTALLMPAAWAWRRRAEFAASPESDIQFDDVPPVDVVTLGLGGERAYLDSTYPLLDPLAPKA
jgi:hypothetical protein